MVLVVAVEVVTEEEEGAEAAADVVDDAVAAMLTDTTRQFARAKMWLAAETLANGRTMAEIGEEEAAGMMAAMPLPTMAA